MENEIFKICILSDTHNYLSKNTLDVINGKYEDNQIINETFRMPKNCDDIAIKNQISKIKHDKPSLIIHAGDICKQKILDTLSSITKLIAVQGNCDPDSLIIGNKELEFFEYIDISGCKFAIAHEPAFLRKAIKGDRFFAPLIPRDEPEPDILVHGHTHKLSIFEEYSPNTICPGQATITNNHTDLPATLCLAYVANSKLICVDTIKL